MKRVLVVIHTPVYGGPHNQVVRLAKPLERRGWETVAVLPREDGGCAGRLRKADIIVEEIELHRLRRTFDPGTQARFARGFLRDVRSLRHVIRTFDADVVQVCGAMHLQGGIAARRQGVPIVWQLLSTFAPMALRHVCMPFVRRWASVLMSTGLDVARKHPGAMAFGDRLVPFYPPVDLGQFYPSSERREMARVALGVPSDAFLVGTVGNFNRQKAHDHLVRAAACIIKAVPDTYVSVLGRSTPTNAAYYEQHVVRLAERLNLLQDDVLRFEEPASEVSDLLPAFDVFLLTSRAEGVPTVLLEAMASGIPVVCTDVGSVREVVSEGITGYVVPPGQWRMIADRVIMLLRDQQLRKRMSEKCRSSAEERFGLEMCADTHAAAYELARLDES